MTTLKKTWMFEDCYSIALYHNVISGLRFILVNEEEIPSSGGVSSTRKNLKEPDSFDEISFQIIDSKGEKINVSVIISPASKTSSLQHSEPYEYTCAVSYENPCIVTVEYSSVNGSLNWAVYDQLSLVESC